MIKIKFKKWRLYTNLFLGSFWVGLGIVDLIVSGDLEVFQYLYIACGVLYLFHFFYDFKHQYLIVENQSIRKNVLYGGWNRKINFEDVICIEKTNLNYTLNTESNQLKINADLIEDKSYKELKFILKSLNLPEDNKPVFV